MTPWSTGRSGSTRPRAIVIWASPRTSEVMSTQAPSMYSSTVFGRGVAGQAMSPAPARGAAEDGLDVAALLHDRSPQHLDQEPVESAPACFDLQAERAAGRSEERRVGKECRSRW